MVRPFTTEEFIEKARKIHGNKYNYSKVEYKKNSIKVIIICPKHGEFKQKPNHHLNRKQGCAKCYGNYKYSTKEWIEEAKRINGDIYNYSKVNYINNRTKIIIICPRGHEYKQVPLSHLNKIGCSTCSGLHRYSTEEWIKKAKEVHDNKYDYSKVEYINTIIKVIIICPEHGEFEQTPKDHLNKKGCRVCNNSKGEMKIHKLLESQSIKFLEEYSYDNLIGNGSGLLRFDFAVFENGNLKFLLEYQGEQHFRPWGNTPELIKASKNTQAHDLLKINYCEQNDIPIEYINYDQDIEERVYYLLNKHDLADRSHS